MIQSPTRELLGTSSWGFTCSVRAVFIALVAFPFCEFGRKHFLAVEVRYGSGGRKHMISLKKFVLGTFD